MNKGGWKLQVYRSIKIQVHEIQVNAGLNFYIARQLLDHQDPIHRSVSQGQVETIQVSTQILHVRISNLLASSYTVSIRASADLDCQKKLIYWFCSVACLSMVSVFGCLMFSLMETMLSSICPRRSATPHILWSVER